MSTRQFTYDPRYNIVYIRFSEKTSEVESIKISDELVVDIAPNGKIYGLKLLNAIEQLEREDMGKLLIVNEATGKKTEIQLNST